MGIGAVMDWSSSYRPERKASWEDIAQAIRDTVTMDDVLDAYCPGIQRRNHRMPCPIHNGKDPNFSYTRTGYKCFVCGASGDVVAFVMDITGLRSRADAMRRINADLRLGLPIGEEINAAQSAEISRRRAETERKRQEQEQWRERYHALMDEWVELDKAKRTADPGSTEWADAVKRIDYVSYLLDSLPPEPK